MLINTTRNIDITYISGKTIDEICDNIKKKYNEANINGTVNSIVVDYHTEYEDVCIDLNISVSREETEREKTNRLHQQEYNSRQKIELYEKLKKEFGDS